MNLLLRWIDRWIARRGLRATLRLAWLKQWLPKDHRHWLETPRPFDAWLSVNGTSPLASENLVAALTARNGRLPRLSVVMPVYRPAMDMLAAAIGSVRKQVFQDWQLCIVDDGSRDPELTAYLTNLAASDPRIRISIDDTNRGIGSATNSAAALANGEILLFLDQDDLLTPDCIARFAIHFSDFPECDLSYSDSDKLAADGRRKSPTFKPGWSPILLLSYMYLSHAMAVKRELFVTLGGIRPEFDGSQDFDFALRASELARRIDHIPQILYHWREGPGSTALSGNAKPQSIEAGRRAVTEAVTRRGLCATVEQPVWARNTHLGLFELAFVPPTCSISVVIPVQSRKTDLDALLYPLKTGGVQVTEIILCLPDPFDVVALDTLASSATIRLCKAPCPAEDLASLLNFGAKAARGDYILFLCQPFLPKRKNWLANMAGYCNAAGAGAVGARILSNDERIDQSGFAAAAGAPSALPRFRGLHTSKPGYMYLAKVTHECAAVSATCMLVPGDIFLATGGFPPGLHSADACGLSYCAALTLKDKTTLLCAAAELMLDPKQAASGLRHLPLLGTDALYDSFYNPNLGNSQPLFRPAARRIALDIPAAPIHVVFVSHSLNREGAQITLFDLIAGLQSQGRFRCTVIAPNDGPLAADFRALGIAVHMFDTPPRRASPNRYWADCIRLRELLERLEAQVVLANTLDMHMAVHAASLAGIGVLWWHHEAGIWHRYFRRAPLRVQALAYAAFAQAYRVIFVAEATRAAWTPVSTRQNFHVIRHAIPPARLSAETGRWHRGDAREELGVEEAEILILAVGSLCARKGQEDLIRTVTLLQEECLARIRIFIVGAPVELPYLDCLNHELAKLAHPVRARVTITGAVEDVTLFYAAADIFVCCSRRESAPRVLMEAMAFRLPIISTAVDGIPEIVRQDWNCLFYDPGQTDQLAIRLERLVQAPAERALLGQRGYAMLSEIGDYQHMVSAFASALIEASLLDKQD
ncbi:glycosyltransferase [Sphingobium sp. CFD-2]|uniref:glycosyltransferase n=1 Tax=Sphingobium sp. CFD-2 TaxID=2878542 RepID=UPI00214CC8DF|nr:glycosyltransferase [Sphingobium sp. CFD-2]